MMNTKHETQQPSQAVASAAERLPTYAQHAQQFDAPRQQAAPIYRRPGFVRRTLFLVTCLLILGVMLTGLVFAIDFYKNAKHNPGSTDPNIVPAQATIAGFARGADVVARQIDHPALKMFACPQVPGLSCGWGQACSHDGCIDLHANRHDNPGAAESSEPTPYTTSSAVPTEYSATPTASWTAPITLPLTWGITYPTIASSATAPDGGAGTETSPTSYGPTSSTTGTEGLLPGETSTSSEAPADSPTDNPESPDLPNAAMRLDGETCLISAVAWTLAMALAGMLL